MLADIVAWINGDFYQVSENDYSLLKDPAKTIAFQPFACMVFEQLNDIEHELTLILHKICALNGMAGFVATFPEPDAFFGTTKSAIF